jgi:hypothetical protein
MPDTVSQSIDRLRDRYRFRFGGHPRVTRDPEELEEMLEELGRIEVGGDTALADRVATERDLFTKEVAAIRTARAIPFAVPASRIRVWADLAFQRYRREFAGRERSSRDLQLLIEIREDLTALRADADALHRQAPEQQLDKVVASIERALRLYEDEAEAIRRARRAGSPADIGTRFARLANAQFDVYQDGFAGKSRMSRHPPTLLRIVGALDEIRRAMQALALDGFRDESNTKNIVVVEDRIGQYRRELEAIAAARASASVSERAAALGTAANQVFADYREAFAGKARESRDENLLSRLAERLMPIAKEMDAVDRQSDDDGNARNLRIVTDNLELYAKEHEAIREAKKPRA